MAGSGCKFTSVFVLRLCHALFLLSLALSGGVLASSIDAARSTADSLAQTLCPYTSTNYLTFGECPAPSPLQDYSSSATARIELVVQQSGAPRSASTTAFTASETSQHAFSIERTARPQTTDSFTVRTSSAPQISSASLSSSSSSFSPPSSSKHLTASRSHPAASAIIPSQSQDTNDSDSLLDASHFLSFEEWKLRNARAGILPETRRQQERGAAVSRSIDMQDQSLGDELDIDFLFFSPSTTTDAAKSGRSGGDGENRNRRTGRVKNRSNHASFDCSATIIKKNPEMRGANAILLENKDTYMLNQCDVANKFVIIELCEATLIDSIVLANYEFFSSMLRLFRVSVSVQYPVKPSEWVTIGEFEARNVRELQEFEIEYPRIYARYLRLEFLSHWGREFYCPLSVVRVYGITEMEEYINEMKMHWGEDKHQDNDDDKEDDADEEWNSEKKPDVHKEKSSDTVELVILDLKSAPAQVDSPDESDHQAPTDRVRFSPSWSQSYIRNYMLQISDRTMCSPHGAFEPWDSGDIAKHQHNAYMKTGFGDSGANSSSDGQASEVGETATKAPLEAAPYSTGDSAPGSLRDDEHHDNYSAPQPSQHPTAKSSLQPPHSTSQTSAPASPTTQESVYKTFMKRLTLLEANATLSLQYIEEQTRMLQDAIHSLGRRQNLKLTDSVEKLNETVTAELTYFRESYDEQWRQYEQLWTTAIAELQNRSRQAEQRFYEIVILLVVVVLACIGFDVYLVMRLKLKIV
ncbi:UNC-like C-terminal-domain-containing protein [Limtongia smithiae]|uniref:UNC-like C-terminal-domain-containing protein n=1 Tax=Limtongia smithiae TaxID=1125753 RepID=UPI0034CF1EF4